MWDVRRRSTFSALYGLSLAECRALLIAVDGALPGERPPIRTRQELRKVLVVELAFCPCAPEEGLELLREFLQAARDRYDAVQGPLEEFSAISRRLEAHLEIDKTPGLAAWFVHSLERAGLVQHGARLTDVWITTKGSWLLDGLKRFPGPLRGDEDEDT